MEVITEEQLDEKLITYNNRKPYGQVVFLAGGAGSGKGFAGSNFLDSAIFKVRDVDEIKKQLQVLNRLGKIDVGKIVKKYGKNIKPKDMALIEKVFNTETPTGIKQSLRNLNLKNPDHVSVLHTLVKAMGIKDNSLMYMLKGKDNPETLPNIMFDITAKDINDTNYPPQGPDNDRLVLEASDVIQKYATYNVPAASGARVVVLPNAAALDAAVGSFVQPGSYPWNRAGTGVRR